MTIHESVFHHFPAGPFLSLYILHANLMAEDIVIPRGHLNLPDTPNLPLGVVEVGNGGDKVGDAFRIVFGDVALEDPFLCPVLQPLIGSKVDVELVEGVGGSVLCSAGRNDRLMSRSHCSIDAG